MKKITEIRTWGFHWFHWILQWKKKEKRGFEKKKWSINESIQTPDTNAWTSVDDTWERTLMEGNERPWKMKQDTRNMFINSRNQWTRKTSEILTNIKILTKAQAALVVLRIMTHSERCNS